MYHNTHRLPHEQRTGCASPKRSLEDLRRSLPAYQVHFKLDPRRNGNQTLICFTHFPPFLVFIHQFLLSISRANDMAHSDQPLSAQNNRRVDRTKPTNANLVWLLFHCHCGEGTCEGCAFLTSQEAPCQPTLIPQICFNTHVANTFFYRNSTQRWEACDSAGRCKNNQPSR